MAKISAHPLKLYPQQPPEVCPPQLHDLACVEDLLRAFQKTTGWTLRYVAGPEPSASADARWSAPVNPGVGTSPGHLRLDPLSSDPVAPKLAVSVETARAMAEPLAGVLGELFRTRYALWEREAELAAGVPLVPHPEEQQHLAARLEAAMKGGAEAVGCRAAALYLLDEGTTELKLRSAWGLPMERLTAPARSLQGALADLEAMLGHAVVLQDERMMRHWKSPEDFPAAVCVPVSTPTTILGTLWLFSTKRRDFNARQTNIIEVVAGRLAADLEREMLLREAVDGAQLRRQIAAAERVQRNQLPTIAPLLDGWELAGWTAQADTLGGDFYDWFCPGDGLLATAVGDAQGRSVEAAISATTLRAALRSHAMYHREAQRLLQRVNLTLWTGSAGDQLASLFCGLIETATGRICYATAGRPSVLRLHASGWESLTSTSPLLGTSPEAHFEPQGCELERGQALVILSQGACETRDRQDRSLGEVALAEELFKYPQLRAEQLLTVARERLLTHGGPAGRDDRTILVIKRSRG